PAVYTPFFPTDMDAAPLFNINNAGVVGTSDPDYELVEGSMEAWIFPVWAPSSLGYDPAILANRSSTNTRYSLHVADSADRIYRSNGPSVTLFLPASTLADGSWHHIALVNAASVMQLYVDGAPVGGTQFANFGASTGLPFSIGSDANGESFIGGIDEV